MRRPISEQIQPDVSAAGVVIATNLTSQMLLVYLDTTLLFHCQIIYFQTRIVNRSPVNNTKKIKEGHRPLYSATGYGNGSP